MMLFIRDSDRGEFFMYKQLPKLKKTNQVKSVIKFAWLPTKVHLPSGKMAIVWLENYRKVTWNNKVELLKEKL